jgi:NTE family protein
VNGRRALVLGSGGLTGLAWQTGLLAGLADAGVDLGADLVVGTSAGALLGARLAAGEPIGELYGALADRFALDAARTGPVRRPAGHRIARVDADVGRRLAVPALARLLAAQLFPSRRHALAWLGRRAAREWTPAASDRFVRAVAGDLHGKPWPASLVVVATDAASGRPAFLSARRPAELASAVAASCALPGVFPAVRVEHQLLLDGGLRSPANLDLAQGADTVLALAPLGTAVRAHRRPSDQAAQLRRAGVHVLLLTPDPQDRRVIGPHVLDPARVAAALLAGHDASSRHAAEVLATW